MNSNEIKNYNREYERLTKLMSVANSMGDIGVLNVFRKQRQDLVISNSKKNKNIDCTKAEF